MNSPPRGVHEGFALLAERTAGHGGLILLDPQGRVAFAFSTPNLALAYLTSGTPQPVLHV